MDKKVVIHDQRLVFEGFFQIEEAQIQFEKFNGQMSPVVRRLIMERGDSVAAILFNSDRQIMILTNQFKYPTYHKGPGWIVEIIAGMQDRGESPEDAVRREILEEAGYQATRLEPVGTFYVSPGGTSERILLYYAETDNAHKVSKGGGLASEDEDIQLIEYPVAEFFHRLDAGEFIDAKTLVAALWLRNRFIRGEKWS